MEYIFIRSNRKTIGITIKRDGSVILRAPLYCSVRKAEKFLLEKMDWIEETRNRLLEEKKVSDEDAFSSEELATIRKQAKKIIPPLVEEISREIGVDYGRISIRAQRSRWGSCSAKGNLNFNCLLVLLPENVRRYVIVHELCHLKELNHSKRFWYEVSKYQPTYREDRKQLKTLGSPLIERIP